MLLSVSTETFPSHAPWQVPRGGNEYDPIAKRATQLACQPLTHPRPRQLCIRSCRRSLWVRCLLSVGLLLSMSALLTVFGSPRLGAAGLIPQSQTTVQSAGQQASVPRECRLAKPPSNYGQITVLAEYATFQRSGVSACVVHAGVPPSVFVSLIINNKIITTLGFNQCTWSNRDTDFQYYSAITPSGTHLYFSTAPSGTMRGSVATDSHSTVRSRALIWRTPDRYLLFSSQSPSVMSTIRFIGTNGRAVRFAKAEAEPSACRGP